MAFNFIQLPYLIQGYKTLNIIVTNVFKIKKKERKKEEKSRGIRKTATTASFFRSSSSAIAMAEKATPMLTLIYCTIQPLFVCSFLQAGYFLYAILLLMTASLSCGFLPHGFIDSSLV